MRTLAVSSSRSISSSAAWNASSPITEACRQVYQGATLGQRRVLLKVGKDAGSVCARGNARRYSRRRISAETSGVFTFSSFNAARARFQSARFELAHPPAVVPQASSFSSAEACRPGHERAQHDGKRNRTR